MYTQWKSSLALHSLADPFESLTSRHRMLGPPQLPAPQLSAEAPSATVPASKTATTKARRNRVTRRDDTFHLRGPTILGLGQTLVKSIGLLCGRPAILPALSPDPPNVVV
jgi:hypothetical protein